jgi:hypothetical protein
MSEYVAIFLSMYEARWVMSMEHNVGYRADMADTKLHILWQRPSKLHNMPTTRRTPLQSWQRGRGGLERRLARSDRFVYLFFSQFIFMFNATEY